MESSSVTLNSLRQAAILFTSLCCVLVALAAAAPVFAAAAYPPVAETSSFGAGEAKLATSAPMKPHSAAEASPAQALRTIAPQDRPAEALSTEPLKPGDYVWKENASTHSGSPKLVVSISDQRAYLYRGESIVAVTTVSTGRKGHPTPTGTFAITEKRAVHFSNKYDGAPMPHMQRLTEDGIALHAGYVPGHPASHGCVRLPARFAAALFKVTSVGTPVTIVQ